MQDDLAEAFFCQAAEDVALGDFGILGGGAHGLEEGRVDERAHLYQGLAAYGPARWGRWCIRRAYLW